MLLGNAIDKDFQMMLLPLNILEFVYCQPKYKFTSAFVTPNGLRGKIHCIIGVLLVIFTNIINTLHTDFVHGNAMSETIFKLSFTDAVFYSVSGLFVCVTVIVQDNRNVQLIIKMQNACRVLHGEGGLKRFQRGNWIFVTTVFLTYFFYNMTYTICNIYKITHLVYNMILFYFDVNIITAVRIVKFLEYEVILLRKELERFERTCSETNHKQLIKYLVAVGIEEKRLLRAYSDIIGAFKLCRSIFGTSILVVMVEAFGHPLIYIQFLIDIIKNTQEGVNSPFVSKITFLVSLVWIVKTFTLLSCLCVACQQFYLAVADVETASAITRGKNGCLVNAHRLSKNVCRLGACVGARRALRVGNVVSVDATTPLQLLSLFATYTIVLLQFAFL